jgi:hypothetical protein
MPWCPRACTAAAVTCSCGTLTNPHPSWMQAVKQQRQTFTPHSALDVSHFPSLPAGLGRAAVPVGISGADGGCAESGVSPPGSVPAGDGTGAGLLAGSRVRGTLLLSSSWSASAAAVPEAAQQGNKSAVAAARPPHNYLLAGAVGICRR